MKQLTRLLLITAILCISCNLTFAQTSPETYDEELVKELVKLKFPIAEVEWETPIDRKSILFVNGGLGGAFAAGWSGSGGSHFNWILAPYIATGYKNYYNIAQRLQKGRNIKNNSADFFSIGLRSTFPSIAESKEVEKTRGVFLSLIPGWGMQRSLSKNFNFEWRIGAGVGSGDFKKYYFQPDFGFAFSYLIKK